MAFQEFSLLFFTRYFVLPLNCFSFICSSNFPVYWKIINVPFLFLIASLIFKVDQGTIGFVVVWLGLSIDNIEPFMMSLVMKGIWVSIEQSVGGD